MSRKSDESIEDIVRKSVSAGVGEDIGAIGITQDGFFGPDRAYAVEDILGRRNCLSGDAAFALDGIGQKAHRRVNETLQLGGMALHALTDGESGLHLSLGDHVTDEAGTGLARLGYGDLTGSGVRVDVVEDLAPLYVVDVIGHYLALGDTGSRGPHAARG